MIKAPTGNIHDVKYLYTILYGIFQRNYELPDTPKTLEFFKKLINDYNTSKAIRYNLSLRPKEVNVGTIENILKELKNLSLIEYKNDKIVLNGIALEVCSLIKDKKSEELRLLFAKLMLDNFTVFNTFLKTTMSFDKKEVCIPNLNSGFMDRHNSDENKILSLYIAYYATQYKNILFDHGELIDSLHEANYGELINRGDKIKKLQSVLEKYFVTKLFSGNITSRRQYDFIRTRCAVLDMANYAIFDTDGLSFEITYLISSFEPEFEHFNKVAYYAGELYMNSPEFLQIERKLIESARLIYNNKKDEFGYAKIADVRDYVCRDLRITDRLFDNYIIRIHIKDPSLIKFTYSGASDKITEKRLPIIIDKQLREFYTFIKIK
ncbi:MAG: hypothetical protein IAE93_13900 [Ignavibacteria bacterium]|nr:hypothetical protein [Ignavibacteria bacterium]